MLLQLTSDPSGKPLYINPSEVVGVFRNHKFTEVHLSSGLKVDVQEDAAYIYEQCSRTQDFTLRKEQRKLVVEFKIWLAAGLALAVIFGICLGYVFFSCNS
jgi:hypothetical protein